MRRGVEHAWVRPEDGLRAIAVVNVEIDDGDALGAVQLLRVTRGDGGGVEEAEAHRRGESRHGGRAGASRRRHFWRCRSSHNPPHASCRRRHASASPRFPELMTVSPWSSATLPVLRHGLFDRVEVARRVNPGDHLGFAPWRLVTHEGVEAGIGHRRADGPHPLRPLRMARAGVMVEAGRMRDEKRAHRRSTSLRTWVVSRQQHMHHRRDASTGQRPESACKCSAAEAPV